MNKLLKEKIKEAIRAVLPLTIVIMVVLLVLDNENKVNDIIMFSIGSLLLMIGLVIFNIGALQSMMEISREIGSYITKKRKIWLIILVGIIIGLLITISEPSVWVLGDQFEAFVNKYILIIVISIGVAIFLVIALLRLVFNIRLNILLMILYTILFSLAIAAELSGAGNFLPVAFDSGGVTTGPMAVPFVISLGLGVLSTGVIKNQSDESFGMVGVVSVGPIIAVLILGLIFKNVPPAAIEAEVILSFKDYILMYLKDMGIAILPFVFFFFVFQIFAFKFPKERVIKVLIGFLMTYIGLVIFLVGASVGFVSVGRYLGEIIAGFDHQWLLIVFGIIFGFVIVAAEPSVIVLVGQVQDVTDGRINRKIMIIAMSIGVSAAVGLAMVRIVYDISIWYFIVPGYLIAIILSFIVPKLFTGIAFDSGGAVSGALTSTFLVPFALGAANIIYPNNNDKLLTNAFGLVAFVAMAPLITIQVVGLLFKIKQKHQHKAASKDEVINLEDEV